MNDLLSDIIEFQGEHRWLSNFWPAKVMLDGVEYPSVENAYQAAKFHPTFRDPFVVCTAAQAKKLGRTLKINDKDWEIHKEPVMQNLVDQKYAPGSEFGEKLIQTGKRTLIEGNTWGDTFWGVCNGRGKNKLGKMIMARRDELTASVDHLKQPRRQSSLAF